jgi:hypothetical protein
VEGEAEGGAVGGAEGGVKDGAEGRDAANNPAVMNSISADATLSPLPQNLIDLLQEYTKGIGGRKPLRFSLFLSWVE